MPRTLRTLINAASANRHASRQIDAVLALCDRLDADPRNGGVVLTETIRKTVRRA